MRHSAAWPEARRQAIATPRMQRRVLSSAGQAPPLSLSLLLHVSRAELSWTEADFLRGAPSSSLPTHYYDLMERCDY